MVHLNPQIFRQYDIRGHAQRDLPDEAVTLLGWAFGVYVRERGGEECGCGAEVIVGRDNRLSSLRLRNAFVAGLVAAGCRVTDIGPVVTPILYYAGAVRRPGGAVMITASHNPPEDNGFKLVCGGSALYGEEILRLKEIVVGGELPTGAGKAGPEENTKRKNHPAQGSCGTETTWPGDGGEGKLFYGAEKVSPAEVAEKDLVTPYLAMPKEKIQLGPRRLTVAVDCGNGTASLLRTKKRPRPTWKKATCGTSACLCWGNVVFNGGILCDAAGNLLYTDRGKLAALIGVRDLIVVDERDALLICPKNEAQRVKEVVAALKAAGDPRTDFHLTTYRPWGSYTILEEGLFYKIKRITVLPGKKLSYQLHHHRKPSIGSWSGRRLK